MKSPAFQMYAQDWLVKTNCLPGKSKGFFLVLILNLWASKDQTSIENDSEIIAYELGCSIEEWEFLKKLALRKGLLEETEDNRLVSPDLTEILARQDERREKLRENGAKGGRPKNQEKPIGSEKKPNETLSSSSSSSISSEDPPLVPPKGPKQKKASQISEDWEPDQVLLDWAKENHSTVNTTLQTEKFKNHFLSKGEARKDWRAGWKNWIINSKTYDRPAFQSSKIANFPQKSTAVDGRNIVAGADREYISSSFKDYFNTVDSQKGISNGSA